MAKLLDIRIKSITSVEDFAKAKEGDLIKVKVSSCSTVEPRAMVYEGVINEQDAFMEQGGHEKILSWRSRRKHLEYLQFSHASEGNKTTDIVIFKDLFRDLVEYNEGSDLYESKKAILMRAEQWRER